MITRRVFGAMLALPSLLSACASPPPPPAELILAMQGGADQNPDALGKPASVAVRVFQLAATAKFERADVFALIEREAATLGTDDLGSEEFVLAPGEKREIVRELKKGTQFIGAIVLFREIDRAKWRLIAPAPSSGKFRLALQTAGITATLAPQ